jgi:hypothetical protein
MNQTKKNKSAKNKQITKEVQATNYVAVPVETIRAYYELQFISKPRIPRSLIA